MIVQFKERMQKLVEEAPSPVLSEDKRQKWVMLQWSCKAVNYENAGTIEFIYDLIVAILFHGSRYVFKLLNTVTEMVTGVDLVKVQLKVAMGEALPF